MGIRERKSRERERRRQQIMVAAKKVFSQKGFSKATMEDIAKEAELSPGTLYLYFKNKDDLFSSLSLRVLQYLNIRLEHVIAEKKKFGPEDTIAALKDSMLDVYEFDPIILINLFHLQSSETLKNLSPQLLSDIKRLAGSAMRIIAEVVDEGIQKGEFVQRHSAALSDVIWAMFSGIVLWEESKHFFDDQKNYVKETLETGFEILGRGIKNNGHCREGGD